MNENAMKGHRWAEGIFSDVIDVERTICKICCVFGVLCLSLSIDDYEDDDVDVGTKQQQQ
jgi:hypothetical protein